MPGAIWKKPWRFIKGRSWPASSSPPEILSAREDDPVRAVRAALEVHALLRRINAEVEARLGQPLRMRTGINTGLKGSGASMPDWNMRSKGTA